MGRDPHWVEEYKWGACEWLDAHYVGGFRESEDRRQAAAATIAEAHAVAGNWSAVLRWATRVVRMGDLQRVPQYIARIVRATVRSVTLVRAP